MVSIRPLSEPLQNKAIKELNEVPDRIPEDIQTLREWILKQPHLKGRTDDQFLITFLRGTKFSLERAKEKYDLFYTARSAVPEFFVKCDPKDDKMTKTLKFGGVLPLSELDSEDGCRFLMFKMGAFDPDKVTVTDICKLYFMIYDLMMKEDDNLAVAGVKIIVDAANMPLSFTMQMTPTLMKKAVLLSQEASPLRLKSIIYVNTPPALNTVITLLKSFLNEKNRNRLVVHGSNMEDLYKDVSKKVLPSEYGGEAGSIKDIAQEWERKVNEHRDFLLEGENYGTDEKKRIGKPKDSETLFGVEGSFRKLNVD